MFSQLPWQSVQTLCTRQYIKLTTISTCLQLSELKNICYKNLHHAQLTTVPSLSDVRLALTSFQSWQRKSHKCELQLRLTVLSKAKQVTRPTGVVLNYPLEIPVLFMLNKKQFQSNFNPIQRHST